MSNAASGLAHLKPFLVPLKNRCMVRGAEN